MVYRIGAGEKVTGSASVVVACAVVSMTDSLLLLTILLWVIVRRKFDIHRLAVMR